MHILKNTIILLIVSFSLFSCSEYNKVLKSRDIEYKAEKAKEYYEKKEYTKAIALLEELKTFYRGTSKAEEISYMHAYSNYYLDYYLMASFYFEMFTKTYPNSEKAEECDFMSAYCYYVSSPKSSLDPTDTQNAIDAFNVFVNKYPNNKLVDSSNVIIDELRSKLERKDFNSCYLYFKTTNYKSAIVAFKYLLKDYPGTVYKEDAYYYIAKSSYILASKSISTKQVGRFENSIDSYFRYIDKFPNGKYRKELETDYENSVKKLDYLKKKEII